MKVIEEKSFVLKEDKKDWSLPSQSIGLDMGNSLTKIAYLEEERLNLVSLYTPSRSEEIVDILRQKGILNKTYNLTGGKAYSLHIQLEKDQSTLISEFEANAQGIRVLMHYGHIKALDKCMVVSFGTGTSVVLNDAEVRHLGGSALGGGFFLGLSRLLTGIFDFNKAIKLAQSGNQFNLDLKVADIYEEHDPRVNPLFRELNAASFGKIDLDRNLEQLSKADILNSILAIIGENVGIIVTKMAEIHNISKIIFCGGFIKKNKVLKRILSMLCTYNQKKAIFPRNPEYVGAIGALFS
ncbi:MAG: hypothetical protein EU544_04615 [Promethearchaeota archaeon]|nr:MAG: hypothetical protein EU544_04615 [Candidatus Lokiarchaeota archaeon]